MPRLLNLSSLKYEQIKKYKDKDKKWKKLNNELKDLYEKLNNEIMED